MSDRISNEARGSLRLLWTKLEADAARVERASDRLPAQLLRDFARKGCIGADRALVRILAGMPLLPFYIEGRTLGFRFLKPVAEVPAALGAPAIEGDAQAAVLMFAVMINVAGRPRMAREPCGVAFTLHSLGRLAERSLFTADPIAAMFEAHDSLLALGPIEGPQVFDLPQAPLPAARGAFLATLRRVGATESPLAVCRTWIDRDQFRVEQGGHVAAWRMLINQVRQTSA